MIQYSQWQQGFIAGTQEAMRLFFSLNGSSVSLPVSQLAPIGPTVSRTTTRRRGRGVSRNVNGVAHTSQVDLGQLGPAILDAIGAGRTKKNQILAYVRKLGTFGTWNAKMSRAFATEFKRLVSTGAIGTLASNGRGPASYRVLPGSKVNVARQATA